MSSVRVRLQNLIDAGNEVTGNEDTNVTDVIQALIDGFGGVKRFYSHYMGHISPMDGYYSSHSYDAMFIKDGYMYVFYTHAPHHYTSKSESSTSLKLCKYNLSTRTVVETRTILNPARNFWHGVEVNGTYYLFAESGTKTRLATTDFANFTETLWSAPSGYSNMNYLSVGDNNRLICTTGRTGKGCYIYYSDDLGLTWTQATGYSDAVTTHGGFAYLGNGKVVLYCQDTYTGGSTATVSSHDTKRAVLISEDNGETWDGSLCQDADLLDCGITYSSGAFCKIGDMWYFATSRRIVEQQNDGYWHLGDIRLFSGTEQELLNGNMHLLSVVDDFNTGVNSDGYMNKTKVQSDSGNMCMRTDGENLYMVYHKQILHTDSAYYTESNSMLALAIADHVKKSNAGDDYYDPSWQTERDAFIADQSTEHSLFAYGMVRNLANGVYDETDQLINSGQILPISALKIPYTNSFDVRAVLYGGSYTISGSSFYPFIAVKKGSDVHMYRRETLNPISDGGILQGLGYKGNQTKPDYIRFKLANGVLLATINGRTIEDLQLPANVNLPVIDSGYVTISYGDMETYFEEKQSAGRVSGIVALSIDTDGDVSAFTQWEVTYSGENCTFSNRSSTASRNYTCTVIPDSGYLLNSLSYTMGGVLYTVTGDTVSIPVVTGKLVIIADVVEQNLELTTDGLLAHYDLGDSTTISNDGTANSSVPNSYIAWTGSSNPAHRKTGAIVPVGYNNGYCSSPAGIQIVLGTSASTISSTVTVEYIYATNYSRYDAGIRSSSKTGGNGSTGSLWQLGLINGVSPNNRTYSHRVFVISDGKVNIYHNNVLVEENYTLTNALSESCYCIGTTSVDDTTTLLGHVRIYNKALTTDEINNNFKYFRKNCKIGQEAYDSNGNFVG